MHRILVAEDEEPLRELFKDILEDAGFVVETAEDGHSALQKILQGGYDLILLDIIMPKMDGITVLRKLKKENLKVPNGPIVMLSVLEETDFVKTCLNLGAEGYIHKSMGTPEDIINQVKNMVKGDSSP